MARYKVDFVAPAAKEFRSLSAEVKRRIGAAVDSLAEDPRPSGVRKLRGHIGYYRIRVGAYRIVYEIDDDTRLIRVTRIRHRRDVYR